MPRRDDVDPRLPVPADEFRWHGTAVGAGLGLSGSDPERGYFCQWNNAPATGWRAGDAEGRWGSIHRVDLLETVVEEMSDAIEKQREVLDAQQDVLDAHRDRLAALRELTSDE